MFCAHGRYKLFGNLQAWLRAKSTSIVWSLLIDKDEKLLSIASGIEVLNAQVERLP